MAQASKSFIRIALGLLVWFATSYASFASAQEIVVWQALPGSNRIVLPLLPGETPSVAVEKYFEAMQANPDMREAFASFSTFDLSKSKFSKLPPLKIADRARVLIQANTAQDVSPTGERISAILDVVDAQNSKGYVLPPAAVLRLPPREQARFENRLYDEFDMRMNVGGDDVHPSLYGQPITHARKEELNLTRDKLELQLIRRWQARNDRARASGANGKPEFGICRGHQIMAVASGHSMYQDNVRDGVARDGVHLDRLGDPKAKGQHWHHIYVEDGLFSELFQVKGKVLVNDYHHQSVKPNPRGRTHVVAVAPDGVVEVMESKDRLTVSVQFHPEFSVGQSGNAGYTKRGHQFLGRLFSYAKQNRILRECSTLFRSAR